MTPLETLRELVTRGPLSVLSGSHPRGYSGQRGPDVDQESHRYVVLAVRCASD